MTYTIIGTSHIARQSIIEIRQAIEEGKPDLVAVELDIERAKALLENQKRDVPWKALLKIGVKGFLFAKIGQLVQQKLGKAVGVNPGAEMKTALELAKKHQLPVALIDQPIQATLRNFSRALGWREKAHFITDVLKGLLFRQRQMKELCLDTFDLKKVPEQQLIEKMMWHLQKRYPSVYKVLVTDRNSYMVRQLVCLFRDHPGKNVLVIVGAGHKEGMEKLLLKVDVV